METPNIDLNAGVGLLAARGLGRRQSPTGIPVLPKYMKATTASLVKRSVTAATAPGRFCG